MHHAAAAGSSPHTRGAHRFSGLLGDKTGIIPAYAGSTSIKQRTEGMLGDHPRIRGEHCSCVSVGNVPTGSSPHTRGALKPKPLFCLQPGIIPAYAGSTVVINKLIRYIGDHPRIRGEHPIQTDASTGIAGSSPHTRGAPRGDVRGRFEVGIIPAYAGSTRWTGLSTS